MQMLKEMAEKIRIWNSVQRAMEVESHSPCPMCDCDKRRKSEKKKSDKIFSSLLFIFFLFSVQRCLYSLLIFVYLIGMVQESHKYLYCHSVNLDWFYLIGIVRRQYGYIDSCIVIRWIWTDFITEMVLRQYRRINIYIVIQWIQTNFF